VFADRYTGFREVVAITYRNEGFRGFYKGLAPTLLKVVPSVAVRDRALSLFARGVFALLSN
jgi:solute carrier family 25 phosphate transporter 23/24/25/41